MANHAFWTQYAEDNYPKQKGNERFFKGEGRSLMKYNEEEKDILEAYESGKIKVKRPSKKEIEAIKAAATSTFKKDKRITIRLYDHKNRDKQIILNSIANALNL